MMTKASAKRWGWVKKGAPVIVEVGPRDVASGNVAVLRRDRLYGEGGKLASAFVPRGEFVGQVAGLIEEIQATLHGEARARLEANIDRGVTDFVGLEAFFSEK
ncbi:MAG: proline--tRNA ligase, partial [Rhodospirillaceae bacterium]|nr:proline--tRNA ligase [Rhodospirillaceae bacterium]